LNRINAVFQDFVTNTEAQNLRKTKQSVLLAREKYEADKVLEVGNKIKELKRTHEWFLELASHSPAMHEHLKYDILTGSNQFKVIFCCYDNLASVSYKWICYVALPYVSYIPFLKFSLGILSHLNPMFYS
jgi:hypothetical protein